MALINNLTVKDGNAVDVVFTIGDRDGTQSQFKTADAVLVQGQKQLMHRVVTAANKNAANRARLTIVWPHEGTVNDRAAVLGTSTAVVDINFASIASLSERTAIYGLVKNVLANADVQAQSVTITPLS